MTKTVYQTDAIGRFVAATDADLDPLETAAAGSNVYLIPRGAVETPPPTVTAGNVAVWSGDAWNIMTEAEAANGGPLEVEAWRAQAALSRFEMGEALILAAILDHDQTKQFLGGVIPAPLAALIALLPEADRPIAERATIGAQSFARDSPLWNGIADAETGPTEAEIDALFGWTG